MKTHIDRTCLQGTGTTEHYADNLCEAIDFLTSFHSIDCCCDNCEADNEDDCVLIKMANEAKDPEKTRDIANEICALFEWDLEEAPCECTDEDLL